MVQGYSPLRHEPLKPMSNNKDIVTCMQDTSYPLDLNAAAVKKAFKKIELTVEKNSTKKRMDNIFTKGFYYLFLFKNTRKRLILCITS